MAIISTHVHHNPNDPLLQWLYLIKQKLDALKADPSEENKASLHALASQCINIFKDNPQYNYDLRFLKVWFIYLDFHTEFSRVFQEIEKHKICLHKSLLYEKGALFLEMKGELIDAHRFYLLGISRNAEPLESLKEAHKSFLERVSNLVKDCTIVLQCNVIDISFERNSLDISVKNANGVTGMLEETCVNPWSASTMTDVMQKILPRLAKYDGYHCYPKRYSSKIPSQKTLRHKVLKIGALDYHIKGYAGEGGFAQVFKACVNGDSNEVVALKIQTPAFPWEFYMYRQLDKRASIEERSRFGFARSMHHYSDCSILVCDYLPHGTLNDAINSYQVVGQSMDEVVIIYYTIEMLQILETLHSIGIIHGDFKPDNFLIRNSRDDLTDDIEDFVKRNGWWRDQGLCLVDWGRGIDLNVFPAEIEFVGDCRTSGFRCVEMQENRPWKYQVDTYGLCVVVHTMLHAKYMEIEKRASDSGYYYFPKSHLKRYWNSKLWENLFKKLLNIQPCDDHMKMLRELRESFQEYMLSNPSLVKKLKESLRKLRLSLCSG